MHNFIRNVLARTWKTLFVRTALILSVSVLTHSLSAAPQFVNDPVFNQATIIGTVFYDSNFNGSLDDGELGVPGARIASVTGLVLETDAYGRFYMPDNNINDARFGQNQLLKVDFYSLPQGARITSENPRLLRTSNTSLNKFNFGVVF